MTTISKTIRDVAFWKPSKLFYIPYSWNRYETKRSLQRSLLEFVFVTDWESAHIDFMNLSQDHCIYYCLLVAEALES